MCGIAGILNFDGSRVEPALLAEMAGSLAHRGPDGEGVRVFDPAGFAHRRLAILDLSPAGAQPMSDDEEEVWITYNGEIYNFREIRSELGKKGHAFRSATDTEVIIHAYREWGLGCLERFNGMFAFALWDSRLQRLWLVRDRIGIKPLFYASKPGFIVFGSEIKSLLCHPGIERGLDFEALSYYLALNWMPAPRTLFGDVRQLLPGHYLIVDRDGRFEDVEYWDLRCRQSEHRTTREWVGRFNELLSDSVRMRLVSDVPFGSFLSGGLDSSSVSYWMARHLSDPIKTFNISFQEESYDESGYAERAAGSIGAEHSCRTVTAEAIKILPELVWHAEEPTADSSMLAVYHLSGAAREAVKMVLSGDGADEILAGYETYQAYYLCRLYRTIPRLLRRAIVMPLVRALPVSDEKMSLDARLKRFVEGAEHPPEDAHALWRVVFNAEMRSRLLAPVASEPGANADIIDLYRGYFSRCAARRPLDRLLYVDTRLYLPSDMLVKVDRMSMAHGLEVRVPFLDHRLVELMASAPPRLKLKRLRENKFLLKAAMRGKLPDDIIWRRKAGFNLPVSSWIKGGMRDFTLDTLSGERVRSMGILEPAVVDRLLASHFKGITDASHQIWCLLCLALWWRKFIERRD